MFRDYSCALLAGCTGEPVGADLPTPNHEASPQTAAMHVGWVSDSDALVRALMTPSSEAAIAAKAKELTF